MPVVALDGPPVEAVVPAAFADRIPRADTVSIAVARDAVRVTAGAEVRDGEVISEAFPDYRRLLPTDDRPVPVDGVALRAAVAAAPARTVRREQDGVEYAVTTLANGPDGVRVTDGPGVAVNRDFLLEALDAGGEGQLLLSLDGPITPLVISARSSRSVSLLMPVRS